MTPALELAGIEKRFGAVRANRSVSLSVAKGSIHGLVGENGAGKTTLMSILFGFYEADSGEIRIDGAPRRIRSPRDAIAAGVGMVHQHFMLVEPLTVVENVMLGAEGGVFLARGEAETRAKLAALKTDYGLDVDPDARIADLPVGARQRVELIKALARGARILVLDEPTAVLTPQEAHGLFDLLRRLRDEGKTIILITHKLREIMDVTDRVSVLRGGAMVGHFETARTSADEIAEAMVGRKVSLPSAGATQAAGAVLLDARDLVMRDGAGVARLDHVSIQLRAGEIVGVAGVSGNGQSELLRALAGLAPASGEILIDGRALTPAERRPAALRALGVAHVPEDRHGQGLVLPFQAHENAILGHHRGGAYGAGPLLDPALSVAASQAHMRAYDVRPADPHLRASLFSGGNQQKIVLAREIEHGARILLVGQPTRGVDIGAIDFIHRRLMQLRDEGKAILLVSVELDEILALSDRIVVMCGGRITGERRRGDADRRELGLLMAGVSGEAA